MDYKPLKPTTDAWPLCLLTYEAVMLHVLLSLSLHHSVSCGFFFSHFLFPCFPFISTKNWTQCFPHGTELCCGDSSLFVISYLPRPYPLLRASCKFRGKLLALNPRLLCIFHPWDTVPQHPFYLEVIESSVCCPGGRKLLLEVRVASEWYLRVWMGTLWLKVLLSESPRPPASC